MTRGLRKVTDDMKTKNRAGRTGIVSSAPETQQPVGRSAATAASERSQMDEGLPIILLGGTMVAMEYPG